MNQSPNSITLVLKLVGSRVLKLRTPFTKGSQLTEMPPNSDLRIEKKPFQREEKVLGEKNPLHKAIFSACFLIFFHTGFEVLAGRHDRRMSEYRIVSGK